MSLEGSLILDSDPTFPVPRYFDVRFGLRKRTYLYRLVRLCRSKAKITAAPPISIRDPHTDPIWLPLPKARLADTQTQLAAITKGTVELSLALFVTFIRQHRLWGLELGPAMRRKRILQNPKLRRLRMRVAMIVALAPPTLRLASTAAGGRGAGVFGGIAGLLIGRHQFAY